MTSITHARPVRAACRFAFLLLVALGVTTGAPAHAQVTRPWVPQGDSLMRDVTTARMRFMRQQGDSVGGDNYLPYDDVGRLARKLLRSLGREHVLQAPAIETTLDSLGLDTEVAIDPATPGIVLVLVRNPFRVSSGAVGFLLWYARDDLRMQGASFPPARDARLRTWFTGQKDVPYEACVIYSGKGSPPRPGMKLFRMTPDGRFWNLVQYEGNGPDFGTRATLTFVDVNHDSRPEILAYHPIDEDSGFVIRSGVPPIVNEFLYTERPEGFVLHDARTVPGPVETLRAFAVMVAAKDYEHAKRLLMKPERIADVAANGWAQRPGRDAWIVEYGEPGQPWPEWLEVRTLSAGAPKRWIFHFFIKDGRWVIRDWLPVREKPAAGAGAPAADAPAGGAGTRKP